MFRTIDRATALSLKQRLGSHTSIDKSSMYCIGSLLNKNNYAFNPQHFLYFLPLPQGQGSFLPIFLPFTIVPEAFCCL